MNKIEKIQAGIKPTKRGGPRAGAGRPLGSPNKLTKTLRQAVSEAFHELGGKKWLIELAKNDPRCFAGLLARLIPAEIKAEGTVGVMTLEQILTETWEGSPSTKPTASLQLPSSPQLPDYSAPDPLESSPQCAAPIPKATASWSIKPRPVPASTADDYDPYA